MSPVHSVESVSMFLCLCLYACVLYLFGVHIVRYTWLLGHLIWNQWTNGYYTQRSYFMVHVVLIVKWFRVFSVVSCTNVFVRKTIPQFVLMGVSMRWRRQWLDVQFASFAMFTVLGLARVLCGFACVCMCIVYMLFSYLLSRPLPANRPQRTDRKRCW